MLLQKFFGNLIKRESRPEEQEDTNIEGEKNWIPDLTISELID